MLVATDVATRGLDIANVDCVIIYDRLQNGKTYIYLPRRAHSSRRKSWPGQQFRHAM